MKPFLTSLILALSVVFTLSAQTGIPQPTHQVEQSTGLPTIPISKFSEDYNYYDNNGNLSESKTNFWIDSDWRLVKRTYYTLNAEGKPIHILERAWDSDSSILREVYRTTLGYEADGQDNYRKEEYWDYISESWLPVWLRTTTFGLNGKAVHQLDIQYNNGTEFSVTQLFLTYDAMDRHVQSIFQKKVNEQWENTQKIIFYYNGSSEDFAFYESSNWDPINMVWLPVNLRLVYTISSTEEITLTETFDGQTWVPSSRASSYFNADGQLTHLTYEVWKPEISGWRTDVRFEYLYNSDKSIKQLKQFFRDHDTGVLYLQLQRDFDYGTYAVGAKTPVLEAQVNVFPNPSSDQINIIVSGVSESNLVLTDMQGIPVAYTKTIGQKAKMALTGQPSGMYFLKVEQNGASKIFPVVKR